MSVTTPQDQMVDPTAATDKKSVQSKGAEGRTLELRVGNIDHVQYVWTRLTMAKPGDVIWIERTTDGGAHWKAFGRRTITAGGRNYTDALRTDASDQVRMRAHTDLKDGGVYQTEPF
ncbi:hypothetical protein ACFQY4_14425 [Catellatospora bangladeshensis]|uniref:Uncharacterized protein n=1 Tax=Catellatospora bangladeshensis TaxID=310355 RepID=A0A8J3JMU3_9ACTN|nr:hypothetical protein [Catellatospora bangladeshensis]GIF83483.1 hypothetical protein Cba03nite_48320 [Catellatospora bangladeshensis]